MTTLTDAGWVEVNNPVELVLKDGTVCTVQAAKADYSELVIVPEDIYEDRKAVKTDFVYRMNRIPCGEAYVSLPPWAEGAACFVTPEMVKAWTR